MAKERGITHYSEKLDGEPANHNLVARYDITDGLLGVTQWDGDTVKDRVLLSPNQVKELLAFVAR